MNKRAVGYIRVSSRSQAEHGESLSTQRNAIKSYAEAHRWELIEIYADKGVSGAGTENRMEFQRLIKDAESKKFDIVIVHNLSRFSRKLIDNLTYVPFLKKIGVDFVSITEHIDLSSPAGELIFNVFSSLADFYRKELQQRVHENKVARALRGIPTVGKLPYGRIYNKKTGQWSLDEEKAELIRWAADQYLTGESLREIAHIIKTEKKLKLSYSHLTRVFNKFCGNKWNMQFKGEKPITLDIPPLLPAETIKAIQGKLRQNKTFNRKDVEKKKKYVFSGYIRCGVCGKALAGQTPNHRKYKYRYYRHPDHKHEPCKAFRMITADKIEDAVFSAIFMNVIDRPGFEKAIKDAMPDKKYINELKSKISENRRQLKKIENDLYKLSEAYIEGHLKRETIKRKEDEIYKSKDRLEKEIETDQIKLDSLPDPNTLYEEALEKREILAHYYSSEDRLKDLSFDEKRELLSWLFGEKSRYDRGWDFCFKTEKSIRPYGIYINKNEKDSWDFEIKARMFFHSTKKQPISKEPVLGLKIKKPVLPYSYNFDILRRKPKFHDSEEFYKTNIFSRSAGNHQDIQCRRVVAR